MSNPHPKMIKNYFESTTTSIVATEKLEPSPKHSNWIVPKNLKRKIRDILEDENRRIASNTNSSNPSNAQVIASLSTPHTAAKKSRPRPPAEVKIMTRINLPLSTTAVLRNSNTNFVTTGKNSKSMAVNRVVQLSKLNVNVATQRIHLDDPKK